jgi:hypothetical protein
MPATLLNLRPSSDGLAVSGRPLYLELDYSDPASAKHEVFPVKDLLPVESKDAIVIAKAQEIDAILLSVNGDFADIVTYPPKVTKELSQCRCATTQKPSLI